MFRYFFLKYNLVLLISFSVFSCTTEEVHIYSREDSSKIQYRSSPNNYPYSRVYQNPYEFYRRFGYYPPYYDYDRTYIPPRNYPQEDFKQFDGFSVK